VDADLELYQYLLVEGNQPYVVFDGGPLRDMWRPPDVISFQPRLREGDFWGTLGFGGASFAVRPEALERTNVEIFLAPAGELLPVPYGDRLFHVLNITECIDALDRDHTVWDYYEDIDLDEDDVEPLEREHLEKLQREGVVKRPAFRLDRLGGQLFKIPETAITSMYYWERSEDGEEEQFRRACQAQDLTGLTFTPIYNAEEA
jgi:hypothetical protein